MIPHDCGFIRDGYKLFFDHLEEQQVPLLILSAGVGDVLEEVIRQNRVFHPNIRIISNYMDFDQAVSDTALVSMEDFTFLNSLNQHLVFNFATNCPVPDDSRGVWWRTRV